MAIEELGSEAVVEKVQDINEIISRGVFSTPAVAIDGKIVVSGRIPSLEEVKKFLQQA